MKQAFTPYNLMLTAAVGAGKSVIDTAYEVPEIAKWATLNKIIMTEFVVNNFVFRKK